MRRLRYILIPAIVAMICALGALPAKAQLVPSLPAPSPGTGVRQQGIFASAPVTVDGVPVLKIAALASPPPGAMPIDTRVLLVQNAIAQVLSVGPDGRTEYDPKTLKVVEKKIGSQYVIEATDGNHVAPVDIVTVTSQDAQFNGLAERDVALQWQASLSTALSAALLKRQPEVMKRSVATVVRGGAILAALTIVGWILLFVLRKRATALKETIKARREAIKTETRETASNAGNAEASQHRTRGLALAIRAAGPEQKLARVRALRNLLFSVLILAWGAALTYATFLFPQTYAYGNFIVQAAGKVGVIVVIAFLFDRLLELVIVRAANAYSRHGATPEEHARHLLRAPTISGAVSGSKSVIIFFIAALAILSVLQIPIASVVTIGGVAALAVGFAAQSLVRDCLNGMLVLFEDQYVVGDYVLIGEYNGIVETLSLRIVQIRDSQGRLITIPHSSVTQVVNASRLWSRIDYRVAIDPATDLTQAIGVLRDTLEALGKETEWRDALVEPVEWIGVETLSKYGIVLRAAIRTAPLRQFDLRRVVNERVFRAFEEAKIALGVDPLSGTLIAPNASENPT